MTLIDILIVLAVIVGVGLLAYWLVTKFLPAEWHKLSLAIVGIILLIILFVVFFPGAGNYRVWR